MMEEIKEEETDNREAETDEIVIAEGAGKLSSPEGILMIFAAGLLDAIGILLLCFGLDDFGVTDIIGIFFISGWMYFRTGNIAVTGKAKKRAAGLLKKLFRGKGGKWKKFLTPIIGELIPYIGAFPCWTLAVYYELTD